ncbi:M81 family metallopeptidase [uncultured Algimonas sp.]|uniref:M81 family metallopeptidase n=1 Tax=uncultured Algimonas sp. TaxID=1547920 RepID=UPI0026140F65|nr:M81 family metallopeptidase [uncultured Algimonas sp.]
MRIFTANLVTETNTFSPIATTQEAFEEAGLYHGTVTVEAPDSYQATALNVWRTLGERDGATVVEGLATFAQPAGRMPDAVFEAFRDEILAQCSGATTGDAVLLCLHGAMASQTHDDCEGALLQSLRAQVGPDVFIGAVLDPHCHFTPAMMTGAGALVGFKEYPHSDIVDRAADLYRIAKGWFDGAVQPVMSVFDCNMVGFYPTDPEPMRSFVDSMSAGEQEPGILSISLCHGFPWADVRHVGTKVWVVADGDRDLAARTAETFGQKFLGLREALRTRPTSLADALDKVQTCEGGPVVIADVADNAGGGAPADSTFILEALRDRKMEAVSGAYHAPLIVAQAGEAGLGAKIDFTLGGRWPVSGPALRLTGRVMALSGDHDQSGLSGSRTPLSASAWIHVDGIDLLLTSIRSQVFHPDAFTGMGMELETARLIVVKSSYHFEAGFRPLATRIIHVTTPGTLDLDFANLPYTKRALDYWPRVDAGPVKDMP